MRKMNGLRKVAFSALASLLAMTLLVAPAVASADALTGTKTTVSGDNEAEASGSVGAFGLFSDGTASTTVCVITTGLAIGAQTEDLTASAWDVLLDASKPIDDRLYVLKVRVIGADPADCSFVWTRGELDAEGQETADPAFRAEGSEHPLAADLTAGLLRAGCAYRYHVLVTDRTTGAQATASVLVTVSDDYLYRTIVDQPTGVEVTGTIHRSLDESDLLVSPLDAAFPSYGSLLETADGWSVQGAWHVQLSSPPDAEAMRGEPLVGLPVDRPDGETVRVVHLGASGAVEVLEGVVRGGKVEVKASSLGAFAVAVESEEVFTVTAIAEEGGVISPEGEKRYALGAEPVFTLLPRPGYVIDGVSLDGGPVQPVEGNAYCFEPLDADHELRALFRRIGPDPTRTHEVSVRAVGGHGLVSVGNEPMAERVSVRVTHGSSALVRFSPDEGYALDKVRVSVGGAAAQEVNVFGDAFLVSAVAGDVAVEATFREGSPFPVASHIVTAEAIDAHGKVMPDLALVPHGRMATLSLLPDDGWRVESVMLDGEEDLADKVSDSSLVLDNVVRDHRVEVAHEPVADDGEGAEPAVSHTVSARVEGGHGSVSPEGDVAVADGAGMAFYFHPDDGYKVSSVTVDGKAVDRPGTGYTFESVRSDHMLAVSFSPASVATKAPRTSDALWWTMLLALAACAAAAVCGHAFRRAEEDRTSTTSRGGAR